MKNFLKPIHILATSGAVCTFVCLAFAAPAYGDDLLFGVGPDTSGGTDANYPGGASSVYGSDALSGVVNFQLIEEFEGYGSSFLGGVRVASGDINGDGTFDFIFAPGAGSLGVGLPGPQVHAYDGITHNIISDFSNHPYGPGYTGGLTVASGGDFNNDFIDDFVIGTSLFGSPQFRVFSGVDQSLLGTFSNLTGLGFAGEVNVEMFDFTGDGIPDIIASAGGRTALMETTFNGSGDPGWNTFNPPTLTPFGEAYTGEINTAFLNTPTTPGGEDRPILVSIGNGGFNAVDITDLSSPASINFGFPPGGLAGSDVAVGDYDNDGIDDVAVWRSSGEANWFILDSGAPGSITATSQQSINPFGGIHGSLATAHLPSVFSRAFTIAPDQLSTGLGDTTPGASKKVDLFGDIDVTIFAIDNAALVDFDVHSMNLAAADITLPDGIQFLPNTRAVFVNTDAPDGSYVAQIDFILDSERVDAFLAGTGASRDDLRIARIFADELFPEIGGYTVLISGDAPNFREFNNTVGDFTIQDNGTTTTVSTGVDGFSGYALVVVPEPSSLALLALGGLGLLRRRRN